MDDPRRKGGGYFKVFLFLFHLLHLSPVTGNSNAVDFEQDSQLSLEVAKFALTESEFLQD